MLNFEGQGTAPTSNPVTNDSSILSPDGTKMVFPLVTSGGTQQLYLANSDGSHPVQITFEGDRNHSPAWSPCGRQILFVSDRDGDHEIFMMDADGSYQHQLTFNERWDGLPAWSPQGREILFASDQDGAVEMYAMTDGAGTIRVEELNRITPRTP
jgi:TolB protein